MAWTVTSFMVVPIIVAERKGPFGALKGSTEVLRKTWGEQLVGSFSFGMVFGVLSLPAVAMIVIAIILGNTVMILLSIGVAIGYLIVLSLVQSALQSIFQAAVYLYAYNNGLAPEGFDPDLLASALHAK
jgi:uncharacterized membrane protein YedE/YeeE